MDTSFVTPNGAANIGLSAFQFANISQPVAADLKPTFRWFDQFNFGARDYIFAAPQNYVINPMSNYTRVGVVASTQLVKMLDGWALAYSVSVNTQDAIVAGQSLEMWFTPQWNMGNNATAPAKTSICTAISATILKMKILLAPTMRLIHTLLLMISTHPLST